MDGFKTEIYAAKVINNQPELFSGLEINGAREDVTNESDSQELVKTTVVDNENPQFISVYARRKVGSVSCIGDFGSHAEAAEYAKQLGAKYDWPVTDCLSAH